MAKFKVAVYETRATYYEKIVEADNAEAAEELIEEELEDGCNFDRVDGWEVGVGGNCDSFIEQVVRVGDDEQAANEEDDNEQAD